MARDGPSHGGPTTPGEPDSDSESSSFGIKGSNTNPWDDFSCDDSGQEAPVPRKSAFQRLCSRTNVPLGTRVSSAEGRFLHTHARNPGKVS